MWSPKVVWIKERAGTRPRPYEGNHMETKQAAPETIDEYIAGFPPEVQEILQKVRLTIREAAPEAEETITMKYRPSS